MGWKWQVSGYGGWNPPRLSKGPRGLARHLPEPVIVFSGGRGMRHHVDLPPFPKVLRLEARDKTKDLKDGVCGLSWVLGRHLVGPVGGNSPGDTGRMRCLLGGESHDSKGPWSMFSGVRFVFL